MFLLIFVIKYLIPNELYKIIINHTNKQLLKIEVIADINVSKIVYNPKCNLVVNKL